MVKSSASPEYDLTELFEEYPPSTISVENGDPIVGRVVKVLRGPVNEYGSPYILVYQGISGQYVPPGSSDDEDESKPPENIVAGEQYTLWLLHRTLLDRFLELRPKVDEVFAVRYTGKRLKRGKTGKRRDDYYHAYRVVCPERGRERATLTWDQVTPKTATEDEAPF